MARLFFLITLGCKVNQYEAQALREAWAACGLVETADMAAADVICVNTCAVTAKAAADGRAAVRRAHRENPGAAVIVTGCAAQSQAEEFAALPGVVRVVPQQAKELLLHPERLFPENAPQTLPPNAPRTLPGPFGTRAAPGLFPEGEQDAGAGSLARPQKGPDPYPAFAVSGYDRSRAVLKVQDGCSHRCTYCIVPLTRGLSRSRQPEETLAEAERLLAAGFRELILNGINLAQYGRDFAAPADFWDLVAFLEQRLAPAWAGRARIRLSSLEPGQLGAKALDTLGRSLLVAPHLHLSLQSGSRDVLRRMGRGHYDPALLHDFCRELREVFPRFGLGADILTGFPGETDGQAAETEAFCQALPLTYAHIFPYSRRPGTPAAAWPEQVATGVKKERAARLRAICTAKRQTFLEDCLALPRVVVACEPTPEDPARRVGGVNEFYADCRFVSPPAASPRALVPARPLAVVAGELLVAECPAGESPTA